MKKGLLILLVLVIVVAVVTIFIIQNNEDRWVCDDGEWIRHGQPTTPQPESVCDDLVIIENFDDCVAAGYPVMESYPRQCAVPKGEIYTEDIKISENEYFQIVETTTSTCVTDNDCQTPFNYLIRSSCPFESRCIDEKCVVVCTEGFFSEEAIDLDKSDMIKLTSPMPGETITSPLTLTGEARGTWFFEGSFPVVLVDWDGLIIAEGYAQAQSDWMTEDFIEFKAELEFDKPDLYDSGALILQKDNPSGLPEYDDALEVPILFN